MRRCKKEGGSKKPLLSIIALSLFILLGAWTVWGNITVGTTHYDVEGGVPANFDGFRIAHISDLHNAVYGRDNAQLTDILKAERPDIIAITGDMADSRHTDIDAALAFAAQAAAIAPCYYVTGNHEARLGRKYEALESGLKKCGVTVLRNSAVQLESGGDVLQLAGIDDPSFTEQDPLFDLSSSVIAAKIRDAAAADEYTILLSHRPEAFETYAAGGVELVLSGHAHGGQFRLPFIGGLAAPNQGIFPKYDAGLFHSGATTMVVSRGIGNSIFPFRFNDRPEVVIIRLHSQ